LLTKAFLGLLVPTIANDFADHLLFANQYENGAQKLGIFCKKLVNVGFVQSEHKVVKTSKMCIF
jgi:hypothetical protein